MRHLKQAFGFVLAFMVGTAFAAITQRPLDPRTGKSAGVGYGTTRPTDPHSDELFVLTSSTGPSFGIYDSQNTNWDSFLMATAAGTQNYLPQWDATGLQLVDSTVSEAGGLVTIDGPGAGLILGNLNASNALYYYQASGYLIFEGSVIDNFETAITVINPTADTEIHFADYNLAGAGAVVYPFVSLGGVVPQNPNCVWANTNALVLEGATANDFEVTLTLTDPTVDNNITFADYGVGGFYGPAFYPVVSVVEQVEPDMGGSTWLDDNVIMFEGPTADNYEFQIGSYDFLGAADVLLAASLPASGTSGAILELDTQPDILQAGDVVNGLFLDFTMDNDTGGTFSAFRIDDVVNDPQSTYNAIIIEDGWTDNAADSAIRIDDDTARIMYSNDASGNADGYLAFSSPTGGQHVYISDILNAAFATLEVTGQLRTDGNIEGITYAPGSVVAMDGGDTYRGIFIDIANPNHSGTPNVFNLFEIDSIAEDPDAYESAITIGNGFDAHITMAANAAVYADNPPANSIAFYLDENADWSGGGGNDCALVAKTSAGATTVVSVIVLNGVCP